ncbi:hypothetical protein NEOLEDRAFT_1174437 [Neolentinus lepideus HHB14362 ss-1]|uniref:Uncharacterized protein n=1 Tax=Neolentinus lepideus HHB14362 ss-1 TaxID=1314782 RepID=A0A165VS37_9AGAM|nr:hypothetical protein NEOLEDRAFT_1174437 [Neolentinus lepideus HHB14362 ss-1]
MGGRGPQHALGRHSKKKQVEPGPQLVRIANVIVQLEALRPAVATAIGRRPYHPIDAGFNLLAVLEVTSQPSTVRASYHVLQHRLLSAIENPKAGIAKTFNGDAQSRPPSRTSSASSFHADRWLEFPGYDVQLSAGGQVVEQLESVANEQRNRLTLEPPPQDLHARLVGPIPADDPSTVRQLRFDLNKPPPRLPSLLQATAQPPWSRRPPQTPIGSMPGMDHFIQPTQVWVDQQRKSRELLPHLSLTPNRLIRSAGGQLGDPNGDDSDDGNGLPRRPDRNPFEGNRRMGRPLDAAKPLSPFDPSSGGRGSGYGSGGLSRPNPVDHPSRAVRKGVSIDLRIKLSDVPS